MPSWTWAENTAFWHETWRVVVSGERRMLLSYCLQKIQSGVPNRGTTAGQRLPFVWNLRISACTYIGDRQIIALIGSGLRYVQSNENADLNDLVLPVAVFTIQSYQFSPWKALQKIAEAIVSLPKNALKSLPFRAFAGFFVQYAHPANEPWTGVGVFWIWKKETPWKQALHRLIGTSGAATSYHCNFSDLARSLVFVWPMPCFQERVERVVPAAPAAPAVPPPRTLQGNELSDNAPRPPPRWDCGRCCEVSNRSSQRCVKIIQVSIVETDCRFDFAFDKLNCGVHHGWDAFFSTPMVRFGDSEHETSPGLKVPLCEFGMLEIATRSEAAQFYSFDLFAWPEELCS